MTGAALSVLQLWARGDRGGTTTAGRQACGGTHGPKLWPPAGLGGADQGHGSDQDQVEWTRLTCSQPPPSPPSTGALSSAVRQPAVRATRQPHGAGRGRSGTAGPSHALLRWGRRVSAPLRALLMWSGTGWSERKRAEPPGEVYPLVIERRPQHSEVATGGPLAFASQHLPVVLVRTRRR